MARRTILLERHRQRYRNVLGLTKLAWTHDWLGTHCIYNSAFAETTIGPQNIGMCELAQLWADDGWTMSPCVLFCLVSLCLGTRSFLPGSKGDQVSLHEDNLLRPTWESITSPPKTKNRVPSNAQRFCFLGGGLPPSGNISGHCVTPPHRGKWLAVLKRTGFRFPKVWRCPALPTLCNNQSPSWTSVIAIHIQVASGKHASRELDPTNSEVHSAWSHYYLPWILDHAFKLLNKSMRGWAEIEKNRK